MKHMAGGRWRPLLAGLFLLMAGACHSSSERAARDEAYYDAAMTSGDFATAQRRIQKAISENDAEARYWIKLGRVSVALGNYSQAFAAYNQALGLAPDDVESLQALAQMSLLSGNLGMARQYTDTLLVLVPQDARGRLLRAGIALRERHYDDAAPVIQELEKDGLDTDELAILKAQLLAGTKKFAEAAAVLEPRIAASEAKQTLLAELLKIYQQGGNRGGVENTYRRMATLAPGDPEPVLRYARMRYADGAVAEARKLAEGIEARNGNNEETALAVASFWAETAPANVAVAELSRIAAQGDLNRKAEIADMLTGIGQARAAIALLSPIVGSSVNAANVAAQIAYARALRATGRVDEARARVDKALAFDSTNTKGLKLRANMALAAHQLNQALADAQLYASVEPESEEGALLVARIQAERGDDILAERGFARAMDKFPDSLAVLRANLAYLDARHRARDAAALASRFARSHPTMAEAHRLRIAACAKVNDQECIGEARAYLARLAAGEEPPPAAPADGGTATP
ncbi:MAG TPA: tetratricopeptide repeat protein [Sphingomonadaceae bacterium]|nr:tetratricopeptide repeat protein [Sphingomonadaceae bacterium]